MKQQKPRNKPVAFDPAIGGNMPPHAKDLESAILGAIMLERDVFDLVSEILPEAAFYTPSHQLVYRAFFELHKAGQPIDLLTVTEQLRKSGYLETVGGAFSVVQLTNAVASSANVEAHSRIVLQKYLAREMIRLCMHTVADAFEDSGDVFDLISEHEKDFTSITSGNLKQGAVTLDTALVKSIQRIETLRQQDNHLTGIPSGFTDLDRITHGWQNSDLIILAARPAVGKTALALQLARNAALDHFKQVPVALFSLEMSTEQLTQRLLSAESEIWLDNIRNGRLDNAQMKVLYDKAVGRLAKANIRIDDTAALNVFELRARCRRLKRKHNIGLVIIDYLQLMSGPNERGMNREQEIAQISRGLKQLAKELNVPIIALSQLSRAVETRKSTDKMPQLSDLRESGAIEQDADMVMFMYRPEYYDITANEMGESNKGETHIKIAKHRNGSLETIKLRAELSIQKFRHWDGEATIATPASGNNNWGAALFIEDNKDPF